MYFNSVRSFSTVQVKYFVTKGTYGVITHLVKTCVERKSERSSLASTYYKMSVSFTFCKLSNGDKLEIKNLYALCVSCHLLPNIFKNIKNRCQEENCIQ